MDYPIYVVSAIAVLSFVFGLYIWCRLSLNLALLNWSQPKHRIFQVVSALVLLLWWSAAFFGSRSEAFLAPQTVSSLRFVVIGAIAAAIVLAMLLFAFVPDYRDIITATPPQWLILIYILRANFGFILLVLFELNWLPSQFALPSGFGDITTGLIAPIVVFALHQNLPFARAAALVWNTFGLLDLVNVMRLANLILIPESVEAGTPIAIGILPLFAVPLFIIWHLYLFWILLRFDTQVPSH